MAEYKAGLRKAGVKPPAVQAGPVDPARAYRRTPEERLLARLGLTRYENDAKLDDTLRSADSVKLLFSQHIGAPEAAAVKPGDKVQTGDVAASAASGLSVCIHGSISGTVTEVTDKYIVIRGKG